MEKELHGVARMGLGDGVLIAVAARELAKDGIKLGASRFALRSIFFKKKRLVRLKLLEASFSLTPGRRAMITFISCLITKLASAKSFFGNMQGALCSWMKESVL